MHYLALTEEGADARQPSGEHTRATVTPFLYFEAESVIGMTFVSAAVASKYATISVAEDSEFKAVMLTIKLPNELDLTSIIDLAAMPEVLEECPQ